jgi:hypothetical protein
MTGSSTLDPPARLAAASRTHQLSPADRRLAYLALAIATLAEPDLAQAKPTPLPAARPLAPAA